MVINIPTGYEHITLQEAAKPYHQLNFKWRSQPQIRRKRRKAHAAGVKNAFP